MEYLPIAILAAALGVALAVVLRRQTTARTARRQAKNRQTAMPSFDANRSDLAREFLAAAAATGKPRGLRWKAVELAGPPTFATDPRGSLYALVAATISFEAIEGGGMEDVEAVGNLRSATAVFAHRDGRWTTEGRVIFNLEPAEALQRFDAALQPV